MIYKQLTNYERQVIATLRGRYFSFRKMAKLLNRHHSTIARKVKRNSKPCDNRYGVIYASQHAHATKVRSRKKSQFDKLQLHFIEGF